MKSIIKLEIDSEGETNGFFTIHYADGTTKNGWSCDQGGIEPDEDDEEFTDAEIELCFNSWFAMDIDVAFEGRHFATWTPDKGLSETTREVV